MIVCLTSNNDSFIFTLWFEVWVYVAVAFVTDWVEQDHNGEYITIRERISTTSPPCGISVRK